MLTAPSYIIKEGAVGLERLKYTAWKVLEREDYHHILLQNAVKKLVFFQEQPVFYFVHSSQRALIPTAILNSCSPLLYKD